jgi:hypothetical protein
MGHLIGVAVLALSYTSGSASTDIPRRLVISAEDGNPLSATPGSHSPPGGSTTPQATNAYLGCCVGNATLAHGSRLLCLTSGGCKLL